MCGHVVVPVGMRTVSLVYGDHTLTVTETRHAASNTSRWFRANPCAHPDTHSDRYTCTHTCTHTHACHPGTQRQR